MQGHTEISAQSARQESARGLLAPRPSLATALLVLFLTLVLAHCGKREEAPPKPAPPPRAAITTASSPAAHLPVEPQPPPESCAPPPLKILRVRVVEANQAPAVGAHVTVESWRGVSGFWHSSTDRGGVAYVSIPDNATALRVSASLPGYALVSLQTNVAPGPGRLECLLRVCERGVVVVAMLTGPRAATVSQCFARIVPAKPSDWQHVGAAVSTSCVSGRIVFPPIKAGLDGLRVVVEAPGCARADSAPFHTRAGDVTVQVAVVDGVALRIRARYADGRPVPALYLRAEPRTRGRELPHSGRYAQPFTPDHTGAFGPFYLLQDFYRFTLDCADAPTLVTNLCLQADEETLDLIFPPFSIVTLRGTVLYQATRAPAPGVCVTWLNERGQTNVYTNVEGNFTLAIPTQADGLRGELQITHPGYAPIVCQGYQLDERSRTFLLYATAILHGITRRADGTPLSSVFVHANATLPHSGLGSTRSYSRGLDEFHDLLLNLAPARTVSDELGRYVLSNLAAPATYLISAYHDRHVLPSPVPQVNLLPGTLHQHDIILSPMPVIYLRAVTRDGMPVPQFDVELRIQGPLASRLTRHRAELAPHEWFELAFDAQGDTTASLSLSARTAAGAHAETNLSWRSDSPPLYVLLTLTPATSQPPSPTGDCVRGFLYSYEREPLDDVAIEARLIAPASSAAPLYASATTDPLGYFEFTSLRVVTTAHIQLSLTRHKQYLTTNLIYSGIPIEWILPRPQFLRGRVCIESSATPATSFWIWIQGGAEQHVRDARDGRFALPMPSFRAKETLVRAHVEGLAPAETLCDTTGSEDVDVGELIIRGTPASILGRVVSEHNEPLRALVALGGAGVIAKNLNIVQSKEEDGTFSFTEVPPGTYRVAVWSVDDTSLREVASTEMFELRGGEEKRLPDLIVWTTNLPRVTLSLVMPDGTPAAGFTTPLTPEPTDDRGMLVTRVKCGAYAGLRATRGREQYYMETFTVTPDTHALTVRLFLMPELAGTVTLDGQPLKEGALLCASEGGQQASCTVRDGRFSLRAPPGRYLASSQDGAAIVTLREGADNVIPLTRGSATLRFITPPNQTWPRQLLRRFGGRYVPLSHVATSDTLTGLHPGEYLVRAFRISGATLLTNVEVRVTVNAGATHTITLGAP
ncbi:MAG: carboxypeptidase-like regulatory domain-containing protein [bacterium]|nr:carboxypeptidase-like regulatory domain-containing protein [bacterium]